MKTFDDQIILSLDSDQATLPTVGGKGLNLARLYQADISVPEAYLISTQAYRDFMAANRLDLPVVDALQGADLTDAAALEDASRKIRATFRTGEMAEDCVSAIAVISDKLGGGSLAVRSSATVEDLPGHSFAGQQDTFLNIVGEEALVRAVIECWSSLWTARAIGYRARSRIDHASVSLAVIIQRMVPSQISGVLFTANPLTGKRAETVIDAVFGLGEALVSGQVEPDHYVLDGGGQVLRVSLGSKTTALHGVAGGGTQARQQDAAGQRTLSDLQLQDLARLGRSVEELFGMPQDIEWAVEGQRIWLLQSRPITTLYPIPEDFPLEPLRIFLSFGAVQGMLDPMTPLGRDAIRGLFVGGAGIFGYQFAVEDLPTLAEAGQRLWADATGILRTRLGRRLTLSALDFVEPGARQAVLELLEDGSLPASRGIRPAFLSKFFRAFLPFLGRALGTLLRPERQRDRMLRYIQGWLDGQRVRISGASKPAEILALFRQTTREAFGLLIPQFVPRFGMGMATYRLLFALAGSLPGDAPDPQLMTRGLPGNVTTEMDLALWEAAQRIRGDRPSLERVTRGDAAALADEYLSGTLPGPAQNALTDFMDQYGVRGLGEIDLGRNRWQDNPTPLLQAVQSYLRIEDPAAAPDVVFLRGQQAAEEEIERLVRALHKAPLGGLKARLARAAARRMRMLSGLRETPKFTIIQIFAMLREPLLRWGREFSARGWIENPEDLFYLTLSELDDLAGGGSRDWVGLIRERRESYDRELLRRQIPRVLLSDGRAFYTGSAPAGAGGEGQLIGSPVSPGTVEGSVQVVLDPHQARLQPGEILVCPGTDPSWTPLFLAAGGLLMEVGGMMTHGAVVAREYGIPAVVGLQDITRLLHTGQRVRVDGSAGIITILEG